MRITLTVTAGPHQGREFVFEEHETFLVGRASHAHFRLPKKDPYFSRTQFMIEVNPPRCRVTDMNSRNGTLVNGQLVSEFDLHDGDFIQGGVTTLRVRLEGVSTAQETRQAVGRPRRNDHDSESSAEVVARGQSVDYADPRLDDQRPESVSIGAKTEEFLVGLQLFAGYRLVRELGRGGMGVVYLAETPNTGAQLAVKMMNPGQSIPQRDIDLFFREGKVLSQLQHPGIVRYFNSGEFDGRFFIATEYFPGRNVGCLLEEQGPLPISQAVGIACQLLDALDYAHRRGFVHRDIKPGNLMVNSVDGVDVVKLGDFGLAKVYQSLRSSGLTFEGEMGGSFAFAAPEQITDFRSAKPASDLYSVASTLYTLLTNQHVYDFPKTVSGIVLKLLHEDPIPIHERRADLPTTLGALIHQGLARHPEQRFASAGEMRNALRPFL